MYEFKTHEFTFKMFSVRKPWRFQISSLTFLEVLPKWYYYVHFQIAMLYLFFWDIHLKEEERELPKEQAARVGRMLCLRLGPMKTSILRGARASFFVIFG
jgi:hypothetical protein